jgi:predicted DCC family thiol-disulfide oxidoreductase YuxK
VRDDREIRVGERPERPLLVFDGDCGFCRQWVGRWRGITGERVEYRPSQEVAGRFPEIGEDRFKARVWLIEPDGRATSGAGAVFRLYALAGEKRWLRWMYEEMPTFAAVTEGAYAIVARHRGAAAVATRLLWGASSSVRDIAACGRSSCGAWESLYLVAFWSLAVQVDGLIGAGGILPAGEFLRTIGPALGEQATGSSRPCSGSTPPIVPCTSSPGEGWP